MKMWMPTHIQLTVQRARGLLTKGKHGTNDCFVVMSLGKEKYQTSVKEKTPPDVEWCEECELTIPKQGNTAEIKLTVLHRNFLGVDEFLGQTSIPLADHDVYERPRNRWYQLHSKPDKKDTKRRGELEVRLTFTVKSAPSASSSDLSDGKKSRGSLLSLPKVSGTLGGSLASLGHKKKSLRKLAASVGHKVAKAGGRRRGSSSRGTSEAGSDVASDLGWDDTASSNADPGVISEGEEDMFGFDDDQGRRASPRTPELHGRLQSRALVDETPLSSLSSSVQSGLSDAAHAAIYEQPGETAVRQEIAVAPSPLVAAEPAEDDSRRSAWPGSARSSGRRQSAELPAITEVRSAESPTTTKVRSAELPATTEVKSAELPATTEVRSAELPATTEFRSAEPPDTTEVRSAKLPTTTEVRSAEPPDTSEVRSAEPPDTTEVRSAVPPAGAGVTRSRVAAVAAPDAADTGAHAADRADTVRPEEGFAPLSGQVKPAVAEVRLTASRSEAATTGPTRQQTAMESTNQRQTKPDKLSKAFKSLTSLKKEERAGEVSGRAEQEPAELLQPARLKQEGPAQLKPRAPAPPSAGGGQYRSARGVSARLSGRLRPAEPSDSAEVTSAAANPLKQTETKPLQEPDNNPFEEPEKNPFEKPEKNPFEEPEKNPFEEPTKNPFEEPEKNPFGEPEMNPFEEPEKNPFEEPAKNPFEEPEKNPFKEPEKNPFEESGNNPFDEPDSQETGEGKAGLSGMDEDVKQSSKEKNRKRDKLGKMFRSLTAKKDEAAMGVSEKKQKELTPQTAGESDSLGRTSGGAEVKGSAQLAESTLRSVQSWAGASLPQANPFEDSDLNPPEGERPAAPLPVAEETAVSPLNDKTTKGTNLKERLKKRDKPEKGVSPLKKTPQIFRKSAANKEHFADPLERVRRQTTMPRSDSVPLLRMSADADWPRVVEGGNERLTEAGRESHGPLDGVPRERLVEMITELQRELQQATDELRKSRAQTVDMEEYLDSLLLRIMERNPQLLQSPPRTTTGAAKYVPRGG